MLLEKVKLSKDVYLALKNIHDKMLEVFKQEENFNMLNDKSITVMPGWSAIALNGDFGGDVQVRNSNTTFEILKDKGIATDEELSSLGLLVSITSLHDANFNFHRHVAFSNDQTIQYNNLLCLPFVDGDYQLANPKNKLIAPIETHGGYFTCSPTQIEEYKRTGKLLQELRDEEMEDILTLNVKVGEAVLMDTSIFHRFRSENENPFQAIFCVEEIDFQKAKELLEKL